jgi:hypothetical protein
MVMRDRDITKRMNWFDRQFVRAQDLADEQDRNLDREHRHNKTLHTRGVADGLGVVKSTAAGEERMVLVEPGTAYDSKGRAIVLTVAPTETHRKLDLSAVGVSPGPMYATPLYVAVAYGEQPTDPSTDPGVTSFTRTQEFPDFRVSTTAPTDPDVLLLAVVSRNAATGQVTAVDTNPTGRRVAGAVLAPASVGSTQIADGSIQSRHIADPGVFTVDLAAGAVESRHVKLANGSTDVSAGTGIMTGHLQDGSVTEAKLADGAATDTKIANDAVRTHHIQNFQVTTDKLADAAVNQFKILPNAVTEFGLRGDNDDAQDSERAVTARHIRNGSVTEPKLADNSVSERTIQKGAVTTNKIAPRQVVEAHLDDNSVGARQIIDGSVGTAEIADQAVNLAKLKTGTPVNLALTVAAGATQTITVLSMLASAPRGAVLLVEAFSATLGAVFEWRHHSMTIRFPFPPPGTVRILHNVAFQNLGTVDIQINGIIRELLQT